MKLLGDSVVKTACSMEPTTKFQPSTTTKSRIFSGVEITTGGNCNMPMEVVTEAVTRSITRNGRNSTAPI